MFGVGPQEAVIIVLLLLVVFGPGKAVGMARDLARFANTAREQVEDFKDEILGGEEDRDEPASDTLTDEEGELREQEEARELSRGGKADLVETQGEFITATATRNSTGDTSEFSEA